MKTFIALAASFALNLAVLGALDWSVLESQDVPAGEVSVTQLETPVAAAAEPRERIAYSGRAAQLLL